MIRNHLLWNNDPGAPLIILIPGGTGTCKKNMPGFPASASYFWLRGFSCYISETAGQDGKPGLFSLKRCLEECKQIFDYLKKELLPSKTVLFGSCSGGTIATHLAADYKVSNLFLWETLPVFYDLSRNTFVKRANGRVALSNNFLDEYIETVDRSGEVKCPVFCMYGINFPNPIFNHDDAKKLRKAFTKTVLFNDQSFEGASHNCTRGDNSALLFDLLNYVHKSLTDLE